LARSGGETRARTAAAATAMDDQAGRNFRLRSAKQSDYSFALALYLEGAKEHLTKIGRWDEDRFVGLFREGYDQGRTRIISVDHRVVGFIQMVDFADRLYLRQIHLVDGFRGRGIGSKLIGAELKRGAESGRPVTLDVMHGNPARRLYVKLGFVSTGQDPDKEQMIWRTPTQSKPRPSRKRRSPRTTGTDPKAVVRSVGSMAAPASAPHACSTDPRATDAGPADARATDSRATAVGPICAGAQRCRQQNLFKLACFSVKPDREVALFIFPEYHIKVFLG
jgi:ribosomal protein S18 acetylase RimI-like enzyme